MKIKIEGINELIVDLSKKQKKDEDIKTVVKNNGAEMQEKAQRYAPVDTGFLKREIPLAIENSGKTAKVSSNADYAPYQEYGTRYQSGTPHIRPAFNEQKDKFIEDIKNSIKD